MDLNLIKPNISGLWQIYDFFYIQGKNQAFVFNASLLKHAYLGAKYRL